MWKRIIPLLDHFIYIGEGAPVHYLLLFGFRSIVLLSTMVADGEEEPNMTCWPFENMEMYSYPSTIQFCVSDEVWDSYCAFNINQVAIGEGPALVANGLFVLFPHTGMCPRRGLGRLLHIAYQPGCC